MARQPVITLGSPQPITPPRQRRGGQLQDLLAQFGSQSSVESATKKRRLLTQKKNKQISDSDATWLDEEANTVDEQAVIDKLETASDYEHGIAKFSAKEQAAFERLKLFADESKKPSVKRKRAHRLSMPS